MKKMLITCLTLVFPLISLAQVWRPLSTHCERYNNDTSAQFLEMKVEDFEKLPDEEALRHLKNVFMVEESYYATFLVMISPSISLAEKSLRLNYMELQRRMCGSAPSDKSLLGVLTSLKSCLRTRLNQEQRTHTSFGTHAEYLETDSELIQSSQKVLNALCEKVKLKPEQCKSQFIAFFSLLSPNRTVTKVTAPQEFYRISVDPELVSLSRDFADYYLDVLIASIKAGQPLGRDVFEDVVTFFKQKGKNSTEAKKLAIYFLGVYASRGASFLVPYYDLHPAPLSAMVVLSLGISYLDKVAYAQGRNYALPHQFKNRCHVGKPYHFWMAAYLSQYAKRQGFSASVRYFGPILSGIGYDFWGDANGRDIKKLFEIKTPFDNYATMTRIDNWSRVLGAHFGNHLGKVLPLNAEHLLEEMFEKARMPSEKPGEDFGKRLKAYNQIVQPIPLILKLAL